ncbi:MAG: hypothetical protein C0511_19015 [Hyphomicrobium sp.]|nr:hypothetical protein [Hyphomicrobium sp.]
MKDAITKLALIASATLLCGCDNIVPSAERLVREPSVQVIADAASGDSLVCVGKIVDGPCTHASAQAVISGVAKPDDISARWAGKGKFIVSVGSGTIEKSDSIAMNGKVTIQYQ